MRISEAPGHIITGERGGLLLAAGVDGPAEAGDLVVHVEAEHFLLPAVLAAHAAELALERVVELVAGQGAAAGARGELVETVPGILGLRGLEQGLTLIGNAAEVAVLKALIRDPAFEQGEAGGVALGSVAAVGKPQAADPVRPGPSLRVGLAELGQDGVDVAAEDLAGREEPDL